MSVYANVLTTVLDGNSFAPYNIVYIKLILISLILVNIWTG